MFEKAKDELFKVPKENLFPPICIAKTQYSFSCDPSAKGVPTGFRITVREIRSCAGAGFLYPICGDIMTIPGLPTRPGFMDVDIDVENGDVIGLF